MSSEAQPVAGLSTKVSVIAITAVLYAVGKGITAYIPTPWGVGQLLVGVFLPAFLAVVSDTLSVAIGAGLGTFIGDVAILTPLGETTPVLSLVAGVPANFVAFLLFGWFVKRYRSWSGFVAATVSFVTLGNLIAAVAVVLFLSLPSPLILGLTVFWDTTAIPAVIVGVPFLMRAVQPMFGRSKIVAYRPAWSTDNFGRQAVAYLASAALLVAIGVSFFLLLPSFMANWPGLPTYFALAVVIVVIFGPVASVVAGSRLTVRHDAS